MEKRMIPSRGLLYRKRRQFLIQLNVDNQSSVFYSSSGCRCTCICCRICSLTKTYHNKRPATFQLYRIHADVAADLTSCIAGSIRSLPLEFENAKPPCTVKPLLILYSQTTLLYNNTNLVDIDPLDIYTNTQQFNSQDTRQQ